MSARAARNLDRTASAPAPQQLSLPALDPGPEPPPLPAPVPADPCAACGWFVARGEPACPLCRTPRAP